MENRASYTLVGCFVLAAVVGLFGFVIWLARSDTGADTVSYDVYFQESVSGLGVGAEVRYRGIRIGQVRNIEVKEDDPSLVRVMIEVVEEPILRDGDIAELSLQGITGIAFINIAGAVAGAQALRQDVDTGRGVLPSKPSQIEQLLQGAPELVAKSNIVADRLAQLLDPANQERLSDILEDVHAITSSLAAMTPRVDAVLASAESLTQEFAGTGKTVKDLGEQFSTLTTGADRAMGDFSSLVADLKSLTDRAEKTMDSANSSIETLSSRADGLMANADRTLADVSNVAQSANATFDGVNGLLQVDDGEGGMGPLIADLQVGVRDASVALRQMPDLINELRSTAKTFEKLGSTANSILAGNEESVTGFLGDGLNEFYRFLAESRLLVQGMTRLADRLEREGARFLIPEDGKDGYVPSGATR